MSTGDRVCTDPDILAQLEALIDTRTRDLHEANRRLGAMVEGVALAMATMVEHWEEGEAGHQRRVAALCRAIGRELKLSIEKLTGVHLAGMVHDIGKVLVPRAILEKQEPLSDNEHDQVKRHSQAGSDILRAVPFDWPIAEIVLQHHERLDGSGYPRGLKGSQILTEASILGVADALDAMVSPHPGRPALLMETALRELENERGRKFDAEVVDACCRLIRSGRFAFE